MLFPWNKSFTKGNQVWQDNWSLAAAPELPDLTSLKQYLDLVHIRYGLLKPYCENVEYPVVEARELLPSFEADLLEYKNLPGFSMVAFDRTLNYFQEIFQFDFLQPIESDMREQEMARTHSKNLNTIQNRMHKGLHEQLRMQFAKSDISSLEHYPALMPFLVSMDRAQVMSLHKGRTGRNQFYFSGIYASFPSDLDTEIKRYGLRIGKFNVGDNELYEKNRIFVYQHLMELYGFPIASERRTSAALFARRLHKMGEKFMVRTLGQSDRTITTIWNNDTTAHHYPSVEKISLLAIDPEQKELLSVAEQGGYFIDTEKRVVLLRVRYRQHQFSEDNVRQERALSVESQELVHPLTGNVLPGINIIKDASNMFLHLNDIVRGEYTGRIIYKRNEIVENTDTDEKRLKFLSAWLTKHQRRMIGYRDEFFSHVVKVLDNYLLSSDNYLAFSNYNDLYQEVHARYNYIQQARKIRLLEDLQNRNFKGKRIDYSQMLSEVVNLMHNLKFEIVNYFDTLVISAIKIGENILNDKYLLRTYIASKKENPSSKHIEIKKNYRKLVGLVDEIKAIRKARLDFAEAVSKNTSGC